MFYVFTSVCLSVCLWSQRGGGIGSTECPLVYVYIFIFQCFWIQYMDEIATAIGVKPNMKELFLGDPLLALRCLCGPCVPAQYRLKGPGKWDGAKNAIETATSRTMSPMKTRLRSKNYCAPESESQFVISIPKYLKSYFIFAFVFFLFFCMVLVWWYYERTR